MTLEVDGNITPENGHKLREIGASIFVCGTRVFLKVALGAIRKTLNDSEMLSDKACVCGCKPAISL